MNVNYVKQIAVLDSYDIVVAGSGPAGICAAVAAARMGRKTALIERYGTVGGNLTLGLVGHTMGRVSKGTMADEINHLIGGDYLNAKSHDFEQAKLHLIELLEKSGVSLYLQTPIVDTIIENNRIKNVIVSTPQGLCAVSPTITIDATGDGFIAFTSGLEYEMGRKADGYTQPVTLMFKLGGVDESIAITNGNHTYDIRMPDSGFRQFCIEAAGKGELPLMASFVRLYRTVRKGECVVNATQSNFINGTDVSDITKAEYDLRHQIPVIIKFLQDRVKGFENCYLQESASTLGIRETRRIKGEYMLTEEDLFAGRRFSDVVVHKAIFNIDVHNPTGAGMHEFTAVQPYDIPYRCIMPVGIEDLLIAGRCISGTHRAQASFRVMNICMAIGEAAGTAAALCVQKQVQPRNLDPVLIQKALISKGINLFE